MLALTQALSSINTSTSVLACWALALLIVATEVVFWGVFHWHWVPKSNQLSPPRAYRAPYTEIHTRHLLLRRILHRVRRQAAGDRATMAGFLMSWFRPIVAASDKSNKNKNNKRAKVAPPPPLPPTTTMTMTTPPRAIKLVKGVSMVSNMSQNSDTSSVSSSENEGVSSETDEGSSWTVPGIYKSDMDNFLAWALFAKHVHDLSPAEQRELDRCYPEFHDAIQLTFAPGRSDTLEPRCLSLERMNPLHRPLAVYLFVLACQCAAGIVLRLAGFRRVVSQQTGVTGWYRRGGGAMGINDNKEENDKNLLPLLYFHGIAPGGLVLYLPMILIGLLGDGRACFLFDNSNISCRIGFNGVTEEETVAGVQEIVEKCLPKNSVCPLAACGHSFGSCQLTWLLLASTPEFGSRIRQYVLLDPVTILLSDPDVINNFVYATEVSKIRMVAGSELFTEHYLRRHFAWYNSELWLDELLEDEAARHVIIALSDADEIVNSPKVKEHIDLCTKTCQRKQSRLKVLYWFSAGHAACVVDPRKWRDIKRQMLQSEFELLQQQTTSAL